MLYAAAELYLPSGEVLHQQVVETVDSVVLSFTSFACENHAMRFVPAIYLRELHSGSATELYAYIRSASGEWTALE